MIAAAIVVGGDGERTTDLNSAMPPAIVEYRALPNARLWVKFSDGAEGTMDLSHSVGKGMFAGWKDPAVFGQASIDPESKTVCWPGGIDLDPYVLYSQATGKPLPGAGPLRAAS